MARKQIEHTYIEIKGKKVPVRIYNELRYNARASIGKKSVIFRFPLMMTEGQRKKQLENFYTWAKDQFDRDERLGARFFGKDYEKSDKLIVGNRTYRIVIEQTNNQYHTAELNNGIIRVRVVEGSSELNVRKSTKLLLSRIIAHDFLPEVKNRVYELNQRHFQAEIKNIRLKYNRSNWGSCSSKGNINLSTRLLFAPQEVIDYVIIHELTHTVEMNHSDRFWSIVENVMPDFREKEHWLKINGHLCDF